MPVDTCVRIHRQGGRIRITKGRDATRKGSVMYSVCRGAQTVVHVGLDNGKTIDVDQRATEPLKEMTRVA